MAADEVEDFSVALDRASGRTVVTVRGELDIATAPDLEKVLLAVSYTHLTLPTNREV